MGSVPVPISVGILIAIAVLALFGMWRGWAGRKKRSAVLVPDLPGAPADLGVRRGQEVKATYVSTTTAGDWLDRVASHNLGDRSTATVQVYETGILIDRPRSASLFIPAAHLLGTSRTSGMTGKFVGREGILVLTWRLTLNPNAVELDTGIFPAHKSELDTLQTTIDALADGPTSDEPDSKEHK